MSSVNFLNIFGSSPINPMQEHMDQINNSINQLSLFFKSALNGEWETAKEHHILLMQYESDADILKKKIRKRLPSSLLMPVSRGDILGLLTAQDKIASKAKHISSIIFTRKMIFPDSLKEPFEIFADKCVATSHQAKMAVDKLDELVETGFRGKEVHYIEELVEVLENLERETDLMQVQLRDDLHKIESNMNPVEVIFLYKIIDWFGELADRSHNVGYRLEILLAG